MSNNLLITNNKIRTVDKEVIQISFIETSYDYILEPQPVQ